MESAANAAIYASLKNAPLLYVERTTIPESTSIALKTLGVKTVYLVDPYNIVSTSVKNGLKSAGYSVVAINSIADLVDAISQISSINHLVVSFGDNGLFAPATLLAAYHNGFVILFENNDGKKSINLDKATWGRMWYSEYYEGYSGLCEDYRYPHFYWMQWLSDAFYDWLDVYGLDEKDLDYSTIIAPTSDVPTLLERAILGGVYPGRLPARDQVEASAMVSRAITYNAVVFENPGKNKITESLIAYHNGWWIVDNDGVTHTVDDYLITETTDYDMEFHIGEDEIYNALNDGTLVWYYADHGGLGYNSWNYVPGGPGILAVPYNDFAWRAYESGGTPTNPDVDGDGIVNPTDVLLRDIWGTEFDSNLKNLHSSLAIFMACYVGSTQIPEIVLRHGGIASLANLRTLYFGYGYVTAMFLKDLYSGKSLGEAYFNNVNATSYNYYRGTVSYNMGYYDSILGYGSYIRYPLIGGLSVQFVLFGDPSIKLYSTGDTEPEPVLVSDINVNGHKPNNVKRSLAVTITGPSEGSYIFDDLVVNWVVTVKNTVVKNVTLYFNGKEYDVSGVSKKKIDVSGLTDGKYSIVLVAYDLLGNSYTAESWIFVDNKNPYVSFKGPSSYYISSNVTFSANVSDNGDLKNCTLRIMKGDQLLKEISFDGNITYELDTNTVPEGVINVSVIVYDLAENVKSVSYTYYVDNTKPLVHFESPLDGATVHGAVTISWSIFEKNLKSTVLRINDLSIDVSSVSSLTWNTTNLANGEYTLRITAEDFAGNANFEEITVFVNNTYSSGSSSDTSGETAGIFETQHLIGSFAIGAIIGVVIAVIFSKRR